MGSVIITGAAGFLGRQIARHFSANGWTVIGTDASSEENAPISFLSKYISTRLPSEEFVRLVRDVQPNLIVHCAGRASVAHSVLNPQSDFEGNHVLTFSILETLRKYSNETRFILLSSAAVYGNPKELPISEESAVDPISPYGFHKRQAEFSCEEYSKVFGIKTCSLRIFSAYGPGLRRQVLWDLSSNILATGAFVVRGTGDESRDFIHARDVANATAIVAKNASMNGECYNLGSGRETRISDLARMLLISHGSSKPVEFDGARPEGTPVRWQADVHKIRDLGFIPECGIEEGISEYVAWAKPLLRY